VSPVLIPAYSVLDPSSTWYLPQREHLPRLKARFLELPPFDLMASSFLPYHASLSPACYSASLLLLSVVKLRGFSAMIKARWTKKSAIESGESLLIHGPHPRNPHIFFSMTTPYLSQILFTAVLRNCAMRIMRKLSGWISRMA
jgi:hypothetical protein